MAQMRDGRKFRLLTVNDEFTGESPATEAGLCLSGREAPAIPGIRWSGMGFPITPAAAMAANSGAKAVRHGPGEIGAYRRYIEPGGSSPGVTMRSMGASQLADPFASTMDARNCSCGLV